MTTKPTTKPAPPAPFDESPAVKAAQAKSDRATLDMMRTMIARRPR
jgi:hypothetical protein